MNGNYTKLLLFFLFSSALLFAQEPEIFTVEDFDLKGNVKSCTVITDYGREVFEFDDLGRLVKTTTHYNEQDQDITFYKYQAGRLVERRMESYKNNELDTATSMANFYELDTTSTKVIVEKIISYDKEFVETQLYKFNESDTLVGITTSHLDAVDETTIEYTSFKDEQTKTYFLNGIIEESIRTSTKQTKSGDSVKVVLTKDFLDGEPNKATEEVFGNDSSLLSKTIYRFDRKENQFAPELSKHFEYNDEGFLSKETTKRGNAVSVKEYIFQFDDSESKNWVKKIVTPDNSYVTRKIEYYPNEKAEKELN